MEQRLQERLVGAVILVGLAVLVIPWVLDGPQAPAGEDLEGEQTLPRTPLRRQTIVLDAREAERPPSPVERSRAEPETAPAPAVPAPEAETREAPSTTGRRTSLPAPAPAATGAWAVQVGSFASRANAEGLAAELSRRGYPAFISRYSMDGRTVFRVRVGPEQEEAAARLLAERLERDGQDVAVVRHP